MKGRTSVERLKRNFYEGNALDVGKNLLGKILVHRKGKRLFSGRIVEVEAYVGAIDKAAHSFNNRRTQRTEVMFGPGGYAYIYLIYGMYYCMNVVTGKAGEASAVLLRAIEPLEGIEEMAWNRYDKGIETLAKSQKLGLTNGPGKLCKALGITKENYGDDLLGERLYICEDKTFEPGEIASSKRMNIDYAQEAKDFEWRFFIKGNPYVSRG